MGRLLDELMGAHKLRQMLGPEYVHCVKTDQEIAEQFIACDEARRQHEAAVVTVKFLDRFRTKP